MEFQQYTEFYNTYKDWFLYSGLFCVVVSFAIWLVVQCRNTRLILVFLIGVFGFICLCAANFDPNQTNVTALEAMPR